MTKNTASTVYWLPFCHCNEIPKINQLVGNKDLFWLTVPRVSGGTVHHGRTCGRESCSPWGGQEAERSRRELEVQYHLQGHMLSCLNFFYYVHHLSAVSQAENQAFNAWALDSNYSVSKSPQKCAFLQLLWDGILILFLQLSSSWGIMYLH